MMFMQAWTSAGDDNLSSSLANLTACCIQGVHSFWISDKCFKFIKLILFSNTYFKSINQFKLKLARRFDKGTLNNPMMALKYQNGSFPVKMVGQKVVSYY